MKLFQKKQKSGHDAFTNLILAACEDPQMRQQIMGILKLDPFNRQSLVGSIVSHLSIQGAPAELVEAIALLKDEEIAKKAKEVLGVDSLSKEQ
ncbi:MAG: hypothetical protein HQM14_08855 [SAR324 cluster bacterium]|nr:hypothetical protein [SAR324 cluster bacterium]